jgi:hypothetical protein
VFPQPYFFWKGSFMGFFDFLRKKRAARSPRAAAIARPQLLLEGLESRVVPYSASGSAWPAPQLVTISFVPDGTVLGSNSSGYIYSNLFATFNAKFGSPAVWENQILKAAQAWAQQTNINFAVVSDDGSDIGSGAYQQGAPNFGDIRIGGYNFGTSTLAQASMPPPINNFSIAGDIQLNTGRTFSIGTGGYDLATVASHELGHALGLYHSAYTSAVMYPNYNAIKSSLTNDDINGIRNIYSSGSARTADSFNGGSGTQSLVGGVVNVVTGTVNAVTGLLGLSLLGSSTPSNGSFSSAADLSSYLDPSLLTGTMTGLNLSSAGQAEYFSVTVPQTTSGTFTATVQSSGISLLNPSVTVYASDQWTVLASAAGSGEQGSTLSLSVPNVTPGQVLYLKVSGADSSAFSTGNYGLSMDFGNPLNLPAVPLPNTQLLNGNPLQSGGGQALNELSAEGLVNTYTAGPVTTQGPQQVGMDANGNYVAVWASQNEDGSGWGVYGQRYSAFGVPLGGEFQVNTTTAGDQNAPAVAVAPNGSFIVTWQSQGQDGSGLGVFAQRFDSSGNRLGSEFQVNSYTAGDQAHPSVAVDANGDFVIAWQSNNQDGSGWGVYAQRYNSAGSAVGGEFRVNSDTWLDQKNPQVAMDAAGNFVVVWQSAWQDGVGWGIYGQRYDSAGNRAGGEFRVNSTTLWDQVDPAVAMSSAGQFVVTWSSWGQDGLNWGIDGQRYFANGAPTGGEFRVNVTTAGDQVSSTVSMDSQGDFLVGWQSQGQDGSGWGVYGREYNGQTGMPVTGEFQLSSTTAGDQVHPSWAMDSKGAAVALWSGNSVLASSGVLVQMFKISSGNDLSVDDYPVDGAADTPGQGSAGGATVTTPVAAPAPAQVAQPAARPAAAPPSAGLVPVSAVPGGGGFVAPAPLRFAAPQQSNALGHAPTGAESMPQAGRDALGMFALGGDAEATRASANVLFVGPESDADAGVEARPERAAEAAVARLTVAHPDGAPAPRTAGLQGEAALWPALCADCFQDLNWLNEPGQSVAVGPEAPADADRAGLSPSLVAGLAVVVAGSWNAEARPTHKEARRPGLRSRP